MDPLLVIANSAAGGDERKSLDAALEVLRSGVDVEVASTSNPGELDGVLHRAGCRRIVVAGGDGSLHAVITQLHRRHELSRRVLGLIPVGTGNDFARALDLPLDGAEAARALLNAEPRWMDLVVDELGGVVVNSVHLGASAQASRRGSRWKKRLGKVQLGILGYPVGAALSAFRPPYLRLRVEADGEVVVDIDHPVLMVAIGNGSSVGGGTELTPDADPRDGELDLMVSRSIGVLQRFGYVWRLTRAEHEEREDVITVRASTVTVSGEDFYLVADGEISGPERRRTWHLEPRAYQMLLPRPEAQLEA